MSRVNKCIRWVVLALFAAISITYTSNVFAFEFNQASSIKSVPECISASIHDVKDSEVIAVRYEGPVSGQLSGEDFEYLVRDTKDGVDIDIPGLKSGKYTLFVETVYGIYQMDNIEVPAYDRSGYAHFGTSEGVGAYNNDGTLKDNALVIYVTDQNKNTVSANNTAKITTGIGKILKGNFFKTLSEKNIPVVIRFIGIVSDSGMYERSTVDNPYDQSKPSIINGLSPYVDEALYGYETNGHMASVQHAKNVTLEGIGTDATIDGWGICFSSGDAKINKSLEIRNLKFINTAEDAIALEGKQSGNVLDNPVSNCWVHHNEFYCPHLKYSSALEGDKFEGDGSVDFKCGSNLTVAYNYFEETHKTSLIGGGDSQIQYNLTFHHNYYKDCSSRMPLVRRANTHIYNNIFEGATTKTIDARAYAFVFSEYNVFMDSVGPAAASGAKIKSFNDFYTKMKGTNSAIIVPTKDTVVTNKCAYDETDLSEFELDPKLSYIPKDKYLYQTTESSILNEVVNNCGTNKTRQLLTDPYFPAPKPSKDKGSIVDTISLVMSEKGNAAELDVTNAGNENIITLIKGNKLSIKGAQKGSFTTSDKKYVAVSKKGLIKAKKATTTESLLDENIKKDAIKITYTLPDEDTERTLWIIVIDPIVAVNDVYGTGLKCTAQIGSDLDVTVKLPFNSTYYADKSKVSGLNEFAEPVLADDGLWHIKASNVQKYTAKVCFNVNGKLVKIGIRVK